jgi:hypothetical protein
VEVELVVMEIQFLLIQVYQEDQVEVELLGEMDLVMQVEQEIVRQQVRLKEVMEVQVQLHLDHLQEEVAEVELQQ